MFSDKEKIENIVTEARKCVNEMNETLECIQEILCHCCSKLCTPLRGVEGPHWGLTVRPAKGI